MPELPEVETVCSYICKTFKGEEIVSAEVFRFDLRIGTSVPQDFIKRVTGTKITDVCRRGKYILVHLSSEEIMTVHLGMTGRFIAHDHSYILGLTLAVEHNLAYMNKLMSDLRDHIEKGTLS